MNYSSQGSALGAMVGQMTYGKRQWESLDEKMRTLIPVLHFSMKDQIKMIDADTTAFNDYMVYLIIFIMLHYPVTILFKT